MKKFALIALPLSLALVACDSSTTEETTVEPMATETAMVEPMATDTAAPMATDPMADPMATDTTAADPMATGTATPMATPMATETPM